MPIDSGELEGKKETRTEEPVGVEIEIGGQKYMVNEAMAAAIRAERENVSRSSDALKQEFQNQIETIRSEIKRPEPEKKETKEVSFWDEPEKYFEKFRGDIEKRINDATENVKKDLVSQYQSDKSTESFWSAFYGEHKDLKEDDFIVKSVLQRDYDELKSLPVSKARAELAERTRKTLLKYTGTKSTDKTPVVEGGPTPTPKKTDRKEPEKILSLADMVKQRREAKRKRQTA